MSGRCCRRRCCSRRRFGRSSPDALWRTEFALRQVAKQQNGHNAKNPTSDQLIKRRKRKDARILGMPTPLSVLSRGVGPSTQDLHPVQPLGELSAIQVLSIGSPLFGGKPSWTGPTVLDTRRTTAVACQKGQVSLKHSKGQSAQTRVHQVGLKPSFNTEITNVGIRRGSVISYDDKNGSHKLSD